MTTVNRADLLVRQIRFAQAVFWDAWRKENMRHALRRYEKLIPYQVGSDHIRDFNRNNRVIVGHWAQIWNWGKISCSSGLCERTTAIELTSEKRAKNVQ